MPIRIRGLPAVEVGVRVVEGDGQRLDLLHLVWPLLQQHGRLRLGRRVVRLGLGVVVVGVGRRMVVYIVVGLGMVGVVVRLGLMVGVVVGLGLVVGVLSVGVGCKEVRLFIEVLVVEGGRELRRPLVRVQDKVVKVLARLDVVPLHAASVAQGVELGKGKVALKVFGLVRRGRLPSRGRGRGLGFGDAVGRGARSLGRYPELGVTGIGVISVVRGLGCAVGRCIGCAIGRGAGLFRRRRGVTGIGVVSVSVRCLGIQFVRVKRRVKGKVAGAEGAEPKVRNLGRGEILLLNVGSLKKCNCVYSISKVSDSVATTQQR